MGAAEVEEADVSAKMDCTSLSVVCSPLRAAIGPLHRVSWLTPSDRRLFLSLAVKESAQGMAEGMRQTAGAQAESLAQTGGQVKDALAGAAATASSVAGRASPRSHYGPSRLVTWRRSPPLLSTGVLPDMEKQQPSQADVPPELKSDPYAGEKADEVLKAQGKDLGTSGNKAGYSCVLRSSETHCSPVACLVTDAILPLTLQRQPRHR
jgi:hypothetical protein